MNARSLLLRLTTSLILSSSLMAQGGGGRLPTLTHPTQVPVRTELKFLEDPTPLEPPTRSSISHQLVRINPTGFGSSE